MEQKGNQILKRKGALMSDNFSAGRKMGCGSEFFSMTLTITLLLLLSLQGTRILTVGALLNAAGENPRENEEHVKKISGIDEIEENQGFIVEKFRALLGLMSFHSEFMPPASSPSPNIEAEVPALAPALAPAPAPSPLLHHLHLHSHHPRHHSHWNYPLHKTQHEDGSKAKRTLVAVVVSVGVATLICALGCVLVCMRFRNWKKTTKRTMPVFSNSRSGTGGTYHNSSSNLSLNSCPDLFYLSCLSEVIDQQACDTTSSHNTTNRTIYEKKERHGEQELISSGYDNASSSSTKDIISVHEDVETLVRYESEYDGDNSSSGDRIVPEECHSSDDDESFHSFVDSQSSKSISPRNSISSTIKCFGSHQNSSPKVKSPCSPKQLEQETETCVQRNSDTCLVSSANHRQENELTSAPQPSPTKLPSNIPPPPPPCPPPFLKGNSNSFKTPPPPPSQPPQYTQLGKDGAPLPKLKPLHWDKVRAASDRTMVWDKIRTSSFELDEGMIESLFGYNLQNSMKNVDETKSKSPSPTKHVLEPKRLQNITILSKALNMTTEQVCQALILGKGLSLQQLEALVKMVPTKEEEAKLSSYEGEVNELGSAEKFVRSLLRVPFAFQRLEAMLYRETFEDEIIHLSNSFSMLEEACKELRSSRIFLKLLEAVLKTGNRMNVGTIRGGATAFKLDALLKLADVKATDGKTTLLHFFVQEIVRSEGMRVSNSIMGKIGQKSKNRTEEEKEEDYRRMGLEVVSGLSNELHNVKKTATIDLDVLANSVSNLSDGMAKMRHLVNELHGDEKSDDEIFVSSLKLFLNCGERKLKELRGDKDRVLGRVKEITEYFHGDVSKEESNPLRIFVIVRDFLGMLDNVCKELRRSNAPRCRNPLAPFR